MACQRYSENRGFLSWRMLFRPVPQDNPVIIPSNPNLRRTEEAHAWLASEEARGYFAVHTHLPKDCQMDEYGNRWSERVLYTFLFTDPDTAFAFKMRFG